MSTNSYITVKFNEDKFKTVYCHHDGYISHNGRILKEFYNSQEKAEALVNMGDLSSLDESMDCPDGHLFETPVKGYSVFYGRDRGEDGIEPEVNFGYPKNYDKAEYHYYWNGEEWLCHGKNINP